MAGSVNKVILIGNLGADPEIRTLNSGDRVANLRLATSETWKDRAGERQERTEWHRITVFAQGLVKMSENYLRKGSTIYVEGQLQTRKWTDQSGAEKYSTEIVLKPYAGVITMLGGKRGDDVDNDAREPRDADAGAGTEGQAFSADLDDEIPF
ncbi:MAG: single-stranded DNA-binding protein [Caulobacter sp.]|nr:single-stranded DNA-binding protein [Caulobacter sp.]